jgi:ankyrin repeat protein
MKLVKALILSIALGAPLSALALDSDQQVEFTDALGTGKLKVVQKYLDDGVGVNDQYFAWSALQIAANKGQLEVVKLLVERGADLNYKHPITKMTALALAAVDGYTDVVTYLLSKGADPNIKLRGGVSVVRAVRDTGNTALVDLLMKNGAKDDGCMEKCF